MNVAAGKTDFVKSVKLPKKPKGASWSKPVKVFEKARYQAVKQLKKPIAELHEIMEEIEKSALKFEAEDVLDRESVVI